MTNVNRTAHGACAARAVSGPAHPAAGRNEQNTARGARSLDLLSGLALLVAVFVVAGAAVPPLLRVAGLPLPALRASPGAPPIDVKREPPEILAGPNIGEVDPDPGEITGGIFDMSPRPGVARESLVLRNRPSEASSVVAEVPGGKLVTVVREVGDWALIMAGSDEEDFVAAGWVHKSGIAVR